MTLCRIKVFCNIKQFDLRGIVEGQQNKTEYNSVMLLLAFYSRVFARLQSAQELDSHKRARNMVGMFFAPLPDVEAPLIGIREVLAFCSDFGVSLSKRKIQRLWKTVVETWSAKIGLSTFVKLLCYMGDLCFQDPVWETKTEVLRVKRFVRHFGLADAKILRCKLFDIYRDKYIYMYSEYENFSEILKRMDVLAMPASHQGVESLKLKSEGAFVESMRYLHSLVHINPQQTWAQFQDISALDFGVLKVQAKHEYKIDIYNTSHFLLSVGVEVDSVFGIDPLEIAWNGFKRLSPGCTLSLRISIDTQLATDWYGKLKIRLTSAAGESEELEIPSFCRVSEDIASSHLPSLGITPFSSRAQSAKLVKFDPTRNDNLRSRRPGSAFTSRPASAVPAPLVSIGPASTCREGPRRPMSSTGPRTEAFSSRPASALPKRPLTATNRLMN